MAERTQMKHYTARLKDSYQKSLVPELKKDLDLKNVHQVPVLEKIVVSVRLGRSKDDKKIMAAAENTLAKITGQKPIPTFAKKSIASFKLREGSQIGWKVTLRDGRMYEFADRLINVVLPRLRDFHGVNSAAFDAGGNYSIGFVDQSVFPELTFEETATAHGLQVTFAIRPANPEHARVLLEKMGMPFDKVDMKDQGKEQPSG